MIYFLLGFIWASIFGGALSFIGLRNTALIIPTLVLFLVGSLIAYLSTPVIGLYEPSFWFFIFTPIFYVSLLSFFFILYDRKGSGNAPIKILSLGIVFFIGLITFAGVSTSALFHHEDYYNLLDIIEETEFNPDEVLFDQSQARFVDQELSVRAGNEILGQVRGMASRFEIDSMRIQDVNGELQWIAPFKHSSFFKWNDNNTSPGYISVSASDYSKAKMTIEDADINYGVSGFYFSKYLPRHLYNNGYATTLLEDFTLEIDNEGKPYWVASIIERKVGFSGKMSVGIVVTDATTGEFNEYTLEDAPEWVDRAQPEKIIETLITDWGKYADDWWNATFIGNGVVKATPGSSIVYTKDKSAKWYTGLQSNSTTNKDSTMGFMLVDSKTGRATFYQRVGITESAAKSAIEGRVQEFEYTSTNPIPYNINGHMTFLSVLKDRNGNMQGVGLVAYDNRHKVAYGENFDIALRRYMSTIANHSDTDNMDSSSESIDIFGTVDRAYLQTVDNRLVLNFTLTSEEHKGRFFISEADNNKEAMFTRDNDKVSFKTYSLENKDIQTFDFENEKF